MKKTWKWKKRAPTLESALGILTLSLVLLAVAARAPAATGAKDKGPAAGEKVAYACPPCGMACDGEVHDGPGACAGCGMRLVPKKSVRNVAILVFDGVQIIDYTGPYEVFGQGPYAVYTVSESGETITTAMGMSVNPSYGFADAPDPDVLIIPGGHVIEQQNDADVIAWVRAKADNAEQVLTVCNGAFILASTGLLDGLKATTFYGLLDELAKFAPKVEVVWDRRYVDNGKIITSAGLSSGIDASLYVISRLQGKGAARALALHLEYDWNGDSDFARAALADMLIPPMRPPEGADVEVLDTHGDRDGWVKTYGAAVSMPLGEIVKHVESELKKGDWTRTGSRREDGSVVSSWSLADRGGRSWAAETRLRTVTPGERYWLRIELRRVGSGETPVEVGSLLRW